MLDKRLRKSGTILMHKGQIHIDGFEADHTSCREIAILAMIWAIGELQEEIVADIAVPGGSGNVVIDLPTGVYLALGIPDPFEKFIGD